MTFAELVKANHKVDAPVSGPTQQSGRPQTPSQPSAAAALTAASAQTASPAAAPALPSRASGNRNQGRHAPATAAAPAAGSDTSGKGDQRGAVPHGAPLDKPAGSNASGSGPPARPPYSAPGRGPAQGYRDDESSKKAVFVRNVPQVSCGSAACPDVLDVNDSMGSLNSPSVASTHLYSCCVTSDERSWHALVLQRGAQLQRLMGGFRCRMQLPRTSGRSLRSLEPSSLRTVPSLSSTMATTTPLPMWTL